MIEQSRGYQELLAAIQSDTRSGWSEESRMEKLTFAVARAQHYQEKTGVDAGEILTAWEDRRDYWYMNYYQNANMPEITGESVRVFDTVADLLASIGKAGFRCPKCKQVSRSPYECKAGNCDWKVYGLFGHLGRGVSVFVKEKLKVESMFMPLAWETADVASANEPAVV